MFAVGHFALGYLTGKFFSKVLNVNVSLPLLFLSSVLPDTDLLFPFIEHRGPIHSVLFWCMVFIPLFWFYKKQALPYFIAILQHSLIGDFLTGGSQLLWPFSFDLYGLEIGIRSMLNFGIEWLFFIVSFVVMLKAREFKSFFKYDPTNFILFVPLMTVLLPIVVNFPLYIPIVLIVPHGFFIGLFVLSLFNALKNFTN